MITKIINFPHYYLNSGKNKSLLDYWVELSKKTHNEELFEIGRNQNMLLNFTELTFNCAK